MKYGEIATAGDFTEAAGAALVAAGFVDEGLEAYGEAYSIDYDHYAYVDFVRGYTFIRIYEWSDLPPFGPAEVAAEVTAFYKDYYGVDVAIDFEGFADDATWKTSDAYVESYGEYDVRITFDFSDPFDEEDLFIERLEEAGWETEYLGGFYDYTAEDPETGALLSMYAWNNYILIECTGEETGGQGGGQEEMTMDLAFDGALEYLAEYYGLEPELPVYVAADEDVAVDAYLTIDWSSFSIVYEIDIIGTTEDEKADYLAALKDAGWTLEESIRYPGDFYATFGNYGVVPYIYIEDYIASDDAVVMTFSATLAAIESFDLVIAGMEDYYASYGLSADIPTFDVADEDAYFEVVPEDFSDDGSLVAYVNYCTEEEVDAYVDKLFDAGWTIEEDHGTYIASYGTFGVVPYIIIDTSSLDNGYIAMECFPGYAYVNDPFYVAYYAMLFFYSEGFDVAVPNFDFTNPNSYFFVNNLYLSRGYVFADAHNVSAEDFANYIAALALAGWDVEVNEAGDEFVAYSNASNGPTAVVAGEFDAEEGVAELAFFTDYHLVDVNAKNVADMIGMMLGFDFSEDGNGGYFLSLQAPENAMPMSEVIDLCDEIGETFVPYGFAALDDWDVSTLSDGETPCAFIEYYDETSGTLISFLVWNQGGYNHFQISVSEIL